MSIINAMQQLFWTWLRLSNIKHALLHQLEGGAPPGIHKKSHLKPAKKAIYQSSDSAKFYADDFIIIIFIDEDLWSKTKYLIV